MENIITVKRYESKLTFIISVSGSVREASIAYAAKPNTEWKVFFLPISRNETIINKAETISINITGFIPVNLETIIANPPTPPVTKLLGTIKVLYAIAIIKHPKMHTIVLCMRFFW